MVRAGPSSRGPTTSTLKPPKCGLNGFEVGFNPGTLDGSYQWQLAHQARERQQGQEEA